MQHSFTTSAKLFVALLQLQVNSDHGLF